MLGLGLELKRPFYNNLGREIFVQKNTVVLLGSSSTANNGAGDEYVGYSSNYYNMYAKGYFVWANYFLRQRLKLLYNAGVAGETSGQILARVSSDVISNTPGYCVVQAGANDVINNVHIDDYKINILNICRKLINAGIIVILTTITPQTGLTTAQKQFVVLANNYIKTIPSSLKNIIVVDWYSVMVNPADGEPKANMTLDGVHPSAQGAYEMGYKMYTELQNIIPEIDVFSGVNVNDINNPFVNPYCLGGVSTASPWWVYNSAPTSAFSKSKIARDYDLEWQQITNTGGTLSLYSFYQEITTNFSIGQKISGYVEIEIDDSTVNLDSFGVKLFAYNSSTQELKQSRSMYISDADAIRFNQKFQPGIIYIPKFTIPENTYKLYISIFSKLNGTYRIGRTRFILES